LAETFLPVPRIEVKGVLRTAAPRNGPIRWNQEIDTGSNNAIELDEQKRM
jgi:hypothetical protein